MDNFTCQSCGGKEYIADGKFKICAFCGNKYEEEKKLFSTIEINSDVQRLLDKCKKEPFNAKKYANLILDIDPGNKEASIILNGK